MPQTIKKKNQLNFSNFRPRNYCTERENGKETGQEGLTGEVNIPGLLGCKAFWSILEGLPERSTMERTLPRVRALSVGAASLVS